MTFIDTAGVTVADRTLDGPHGPLRVRTYEPAGSATPSAGFVWVHGGAFAFGELDMPEADWVSRRIAAAGIPVISVDYQLSGTRGFPEDFRDERRDGALFPVASEEVSAAFVWATSTTEFGVPAGSWSLGGASAGGNLVAGATLRLRDEGPVLPRSLVLAYPLLHAELPEHRPELAAKVAALPAEARFEPASVAAINLNYAGSAAALADPYAFAGGADLHGLPPTFVLNSDADSLRSTGELFAAELAAAGVDTLLVREDGTRHGHLNEPDNPGAHRSVRRIVAWLTTTDLVGTAHETSGDAHP
ncbi:alpha/beta hydrolase [Naasia aerilata]|uniref:Esterase n=1 Tax=Naasia aerilata TaxID=1162966 RepID=A0ABN6XPF5_9MICO|nr:alpha/beta hydrolase [Naasia aerilata]BDZ45556.1 esterase [Naasia aerilata]